MKLYTSREQIIKDIDGALKKVARAKTTAQEHLDAEELLTGSSNVTELRKERELADKQFRKVKRLETVRLPKLKSKLAEWDTVPLNGLDTLPEPNQEPAQSLQPQPAFSPDDVTP